MNNYIFVSILAAFLVGFFLTFLAPISRQIGLVDRPTERKRHAYEVPLVGGIAIGITFLLSMLLMPFSLKEYRMFFFAITVLLIVGVLDDHRDISAGVKFLMQIFVALLIVQIGGQLVSNVGDIFNRGIRTKKLIAWIMIQNSESTKILTMEVQM